MRRCLPLLVLLLGLVACGDDAKKRVEPGPYAAQEILVSFGAPAPADPIRRTGRTRDEARALAEDLRGKVLAGEDIGLLAKKHSNAPGGAAFGFDGWRRRDPSRMEVPDRSLAGTPIGEVTEIQEWRGGWWFAQRIPEERGTYLEKLFQRMVRLRARARAFGVLWKGVWGDDKKTIQRTKEEARERAEEALKLALAGVDFAEVVSLYADSGELRAAGGLLRVEGPDKKPTEWLRMNEPMLPEAVQEAIFQGELGKVWPHVIETPLGFVVVKVEDRQEISK